MAEVCFSKFKHQACVPEIYAKVTGTTVVDPMEDLSVGPYQSVTGIFEGSFLYGTI